MSLYDSSLVRSLIREHLRYDDFSAARLPLHITATNLCAMGPDSAAFEGHAGDLADTEGESRVGLRRAVPGEANAGRGRRSDRHRPGRRDNPGALRSEAASRVRHPDHRPARLVSR